MKTNEILITITPKQAELILIGDFSSFIFNMIRVGASLETEPESIKGPFFLGKDMADEQLFIVKLKAE